MEDQIVNFMKYRAPLGVGLELIDVVKSFKTVDEQAKVVEDKTHYYESQATLEGHLKTAWGEIEKYNNLSVDENASATPRLSAKHIDEIIGLMGKNQHGRVS